MEFLWAFRGEVVRGTNHDKKAQEIQYFADLYSISQIHPRLGAVNVRIFKLTIRQSSAWSDHW